MQSTISTTLPAADPEWLVVFSHGKESGPYGRKIQALSDVAQVHGASTLSVDYRTPAMPPSWEDGAAPPLSGEGDRRLNVLLNTPLPAHRNLILVGSSMGAYDSTAASATLQPKGLFLLAPAFYLPGYAMSDIRAHAEKVEVVHGWSDDIVPVENSIRFARNHQAALHILNSNHRLDDAVAELQWLFDRFMRSVISSGRG